MNININTLGRITGFSVLLAVSQLSYSAIISGTAAQADSIIAFSCPSFCTDFSQSDSDGGLGAISASTSTSNTAGNSQAQATLTGTSFLPILKVFADSNVSTGAFAQATGVQGYTYTGATRNITIDLDLHGQLDTSSGASAEANLSGQVAIIFASQLDFSSDFGTVAFEIAIDQMEANSQLFGNATDSLTFTLNDGDDFFVWAGIQAGGVRGGSVDGLNTFTMSFDDDTGLVAASAVPVPAAVWLFVSGLGLLAGFLRRQ